jgi:hypothetical protein
MSVRRNKLVGEDSQDGGSEDARALFITGIALMQVAANLPQGEALASAASQAITDWEDDYCGTPPRPLPALALATSLAAFASTLQAGDLQTALKRKLAASPGGPSHRPRPRPHNRHPLRPRNFG